MHFPRISLLISALVLTACGSDGGSGSNTSGGGTTAVDSNGACTATYIAAWNDVKYKADSAARVVDSNLYSTSEKLARVRELQNSCSALRNLGSVSCLAEVGGQNKSISYNDRKEVCDLADSIVRKLNNSGGAQPAPVDRDRQEREERERRENERRERERRENERREQERRNANRGPKVEDFRETQIKATITNASVIERGRGNQDLVIVRGQMGTMDSFVPQIRDGATICFVSGAETLDKIYGPIQNGRKLSVGDRKESTRDNGRRMLSIQFSDASLGIGCLKRSGDAFTIHEIKEAFDGILDFEFFSN